MTCCLFLVKAVTLQLIIIFRLLFSHLNYNCVIKTVTFNFLRFRIPKSPAMLKKTYSLPCMGVSFAVIKTGPISVGEEIFADVGEIPEMDLK